jgi:1-acyl-sn-glycerol-3-phosphate acyltransferase
LNPEGSAAPPRWGLTKGALTVGLAAAALVPAELLLRRLRPGLPPYLPRQFHRLLLKGLGVEVRLHGAPARPQGVLFVANHLSWADVPVLGSRLLGHFVAKAEVGTMGPVGWFADLQRTIYVDRDRKRTTDVQRNAVADRLAAGGNVILFPEGTTGDGVEVLPFNSSLFAAVDGLADAVVQPVSLAYTRIRGMPITRRRLSDVVWLGDTGIGEHAVDFLRLGRVTAEIACHPAVRAADFADRKALARHCQAQVADGYRELMRRGDVSL